MDDLKFIGGAIAVSAIVICLLLYGIYNENNKIHEDDLNITEWISEDGVHYWYQYGSYGRMLAPRYDNNGNLVIDAKGE